MNAALINHFCCETLFIISLAHISLCFVQIRFFVVLLVVIFAPSVKPRGLVIGDSGFQCLSLLRACSCRSVLGYKREERGKIVEVSKKSRGLSLTMQKSPRRTSCICMRHAYRSSEWGAVVKRGPFRTRGPLSCILKMYIRGGLL